MKTFGFLNIFKKFLALILVAYYSIFSPVVALAIVTQPVSAPISIPVPIPTPTPSPSPVPKPAIFVQDYSVKSGENLNVSWNIPNASNTDYIRVLTTDGTNRSVGPNGISPSNNCNLNNVSGPNAVKVGSCTFTSAVIADLGTFKLGYYNSGGTLLATSNPFHVLAASAGSFNANPANIGIGQSVNLIWANITNAHPKDYINYLNADTYTGGGTAHTYWPSNNCKWFTDSTAPKPSGSCSIEGPYSSGNYKLIYRSGNVPVGQPAPILAVTNVIGVGQNAPKPDLIVDLKAAVENIGIGTSANIGIGTSASLMKKITLTATVKNIGSSSAQPSVTQVTTDNINEHWRLGTNSLNPGASQVLTITTYRNPGYYQFTAKADADSQVVESKEDNNSASTNIVVPGSLQIISISPNNPRQGDTVAIYGSGFVKDAASNLVYVGNTLMPTQFNRLSADGKRLSFVLSTETPFRIGAQYPVKVKTPNGPELSNTLNITITSPTILSSVNPSEAVVGETAILRGFNFGEKQGSVFIYDLNYKFVSAVNITSWSNNTIQVKIPEIATDKEYLVVVNGSFGGKFIYSSNGVKVKIVNKKPDLVVENIQVNDAKVGNKINADVTIRNIGKSKTGSVLLTTVIKTIQPNGQRLSDCSSQDTVNIDPNQTSVIKVGNVNCASYKVAGSHTIEAFADFNSVLSESNENNNRGTTNVNVAGAVVINRPVINSIWPYQLRIGRWFVVYGSNLGSSGKINFYKPGSTAASASAINYYWSDSLILAKIPTSLKANQQYGIGVRILNGTDLLDSPLIYRYISK